MAQELSGKVAIITGAGHGIGRATAMAMAAHGASVVVNDLGGEKDGSGASVGPADDIAKLIRDAGGQAVANYESVADHAGAGRIVQTAIDAFGRLDILVNNAGNQSHAPIWELRPEDFDSVIAVHLKGCYSTVHHASKIMMQQRSGRIVNLFARSIGLYRGGHSCYSAAKAGIIGFTHAVASELGPYGITVNCVAPGPTASRMAERFTAEARSPEGIRDPVLRKNAFLGVVEPNNIATFISYLASDAAADINGQAFHCYGPHIGWFPPMDVTTPIFKDGDWTIEELAQYVPIIMPRAMENPAPPAALT